MIPARHGSSRFPGKPLVDIEGVSMIVRVARQVVGADHIDKVVVATDDDRIVQVCEESGVQAVKTAALCASGTDRIAGAYRTLGERFNCIINIQGDEPLIDPRDVDALAECAYAHPEAIATLARPFTDPDRQLTDPHVVKVVAAQDGRAIYFSRAALAGAMQHVGAYAFTPELLEAFSSLAASPLERAERLEQLRALEQGIRIQVALCVSKDPTIGVDTPEDVEAVLQELASRRTRRTTHAP